MYRLLIIVLIIALTVLYSFYQKRSIEQDLVTSETKVQSVLEKMPEAEFSDLNGGKVSLAQIFPADLVVVHFWGTWCAPCEAELPELLTFIKRFEGKSNVKFVLVAVNDEIKKVQKYLKTLPIPAHSSITWLVDSEDVYRQKFGTTRVPETYVFSSDMTTLRKYVGPQEWNKTMFFQSFDEFIQISTRKL
ncbi:MAG: TlpA family protein disulfide reductase [Bacteriovoracaceae bacterium]